MEKKDSRQMYAMKYMQKSRCIERDALKNVLREMEILTTLEHPFLVNLWFSFQGIHSYNIKIKKIKITYITIKQLCKCISNIN